MVVHPYHSKSHESFNPLSTIQAVLDQLEECQFKLNSAPLMLEWQPKKEKSKKPLTHKQIDYQTCYRSPCAEIFPLVLASYSKHILLCALPREILQRIFAFLRPRPRPCSFCTKPTTHKPRRSGPLINCGCATRKCVFCQKPTCGIQDSPGKTFFGFDFCDCLWCSKPAIIEKLKTRQPCVIENTPHAVYTRAFAIRSCSCTLVCYQRSKRTKIKRCQDQAYLFLVKLGPVGLAPAWKQNQDFKIKLVKSCFKCLSGPRTVRPLEHDHGDLVKALIDGSGSSSDSRRSQISSSASVSQ